MANTDHLAILRRGVQVRNLWRGDNPNISPDFSGANLFQANLKGAFLVGVNLEGASLVSANMVKSILWGANLEKVDLWRISARRQL